jgi:hypothetical protein
LLAAVGNQDNGDEDLNILITARPDSKKEKVLLGREMREKREKAQMFWV